MRTVADSDWLTLGEASSYLGVAPATTRKWSDQGRLPVFYTPGGHRRFQRAALDELISGGRPHSPYITPLVLVIGADDTLRLSLRVRLDELGYDVRLSDGSTSSLTALEGRAPSLVLLDVAKLGSEGWQLLRQIEEQHGPVHVIMFDSQSGGDPGSEQLFDLERLVAQATQTLPI